MKEKSRYTYKNRNGSLADFKKDSSTHGSLSWKPDAIINLPNAKSRK